MPYIGNTAADRFVASKAASVFSGDGSTTAFTLDHSVGSDEDVLVSVDGVIQEPSVAYSVSGTTLTFTAAPSSNAGNNIFVYYLFRTMGTVSHPSSNALEATSGTFSSTLDVTGNVGLGGANTSSYLQGVVGGKTATIGDSSQASSTLVLKDDDGVFDIATTAGTFRIYDDNTERLRLDANGHVTMPYQSAFSVHKNGSTQTNLAVTGSDVLITFAGERFDQNSDFDTTTSTFTAPVTGKYLLSCTLRTESVDTAADFIIIRITTSNENYAHIYDPDVFDSDAPYYSQGVTILADMDAGDTAVVNARISGGTQQMDVSGNAQYTYFTGYLVA